MVLPVLWTMVSVRIFASLCPVAMCAGVEMGGSSLQTTQPVKVKCFVNVTKMGNKLPYWPNSILVKVPFQLS